MYNKGMSSKYVSIADRQVKRISEIDQKRNVVDNRLQVLRNNLCRASMEWALTDMPIGDLQDRLLKIFNLPVFGSYKDKRMYISALSLGKELRTRYKANVKISGTANAQSRMVIDLIKSSHVKALNREKYRVSNRFEAKRKKEIMDKDIEKSRNLAVPIVFYLASSHSKPAKDHKNYQGKIYVDKEWKNILLQAHIGDTIIKKCQEYIKKNKIQAVQRVVGSPVYFIYRPFCKHFFVPIPTRKVLDTPKTKLMYLAKSKGTQALEDRKNRQGNGTRKEINAREHYKRLEFVSGLGKGNSLPKPILNKLGLLQRKEKAFYNCWSKK